MEHTKLLSELRILRDSRGFIAEEYLVKKQQLMRNFFEDSGINAVVVGLSGGVDSALVAALLCDFANLPESPLKKVSAVIAPIFGSGTSGQADAQDLAVLQSLAVSEKSAAFEYQVCDLTASYEAMLAAHPYREATAWAEGQMASVLRTPLFYYQAAILQQQGFRSLLCGTTNRDEGAYIGFFGKASDAMVDLQLIADLHKSEVYKLAAHLGVIQEILNSVPRGDVWDNRNDEQMIGAPYWFLELYQRLLCADTEVDFSESLHGEEKEFYQLCKNNIEALHRINLHKYQVGNPAHFLDVLDRKVPGGW
jgi:NAD+ synthase (glutamine-hydrolysing)